MHQLLYQLLFVLCSNFQDKGEEIVGLFSFFMGIALLIPTFNPLHFISWNTLHTTALLFSLEWCKIGFSLLYFIFEHHTCNIKHLIDPFVDQRSTFITLNPRLHSNSSNPKDTNYRHFRQKNISKRRTSPIHHYYLKLKANKSTTLKSPPSYHQRVNFSTNIKRDRRSKRQSYAAHFTSFSFEKKTKSIRCATWIASFLSCNIPWIYNFNDEKFNTVVQTSLHNYLAIGIESMNILRNKMSGIIEFYYDIPLVSNFKFRVTDINFASQEYSHSKSLIHLPSFIIDTFCQHTDVLLLNNLCSSFLNPTIQSNTQSFFESTIKQELNKYKSFLYYNDSHDVQVSQVFFSKYDEENVPIVLDSGASKGLTPFRKDFVSFRPLKSIINGIGATCSIDGVGIVRWEIIDQKGIKQTIETEAYYVPSAKIRLYSPQDHFRQQKKGSVTMNHNEVLLRLPNKTTPLSFPFHPTSNLPLMIIPPRCHEHASLCMEPNLSHTYSVDASSQDQLFRAEFYDGFDSEAINIAVDAESNSNLTRSQLELLYLHYCAGHMSMNHLQRMIHPELPLDNRDTDHELKMPKIWKSKNKSTQSCDVPKCAACLLGKMEQLPINNNVKTSTNPGSLRANDLQPGDMVSCDQYVVSTPGRTLKHSSNKKEKYSGGTIYVDHASQRIFNYNQISLRAGETLVGKRILDNEAASLGFEIKKFLSDNGIFVSKEFKGDLVRRNQTLRLSGVGAHHQNGVAERSIKTVTYLARTMLIHSAIRWPGQMDLELWPFAFDHAVHVYNNLPGRDGLAPFEKWTGTKNLNFDHIRRLKPWGCPAYVLDPTLQDGKKLPKWKPRSRQGKFLGYSKHHASSVGLILNLQTKRISPQFHVLYDGLFTTVRGIDDIKDPILDDVDWDNMIDIFGTEKHFDINDTSVILPPVSDEWLDDTEIRQRQANPRQFRQHQQQPSELQGEDIRDDSLHRPIVIDDHDDEIEVLKVVPGSVPSDIPIKRERQVRFKEESTQSSPLPLPPTTPLFEQEINIENQGSKRQTNSQT